MMHVPNRIRKLDKVSNVQLFTDNDLLDDLAEVHQVSNVHRQLCVLHQHPKEYSTDQGPNLSNQTYAIELNTTFYMDTKGGRTGEQI